MFQCRGYLVTQRTSTNKNDGKLFFSVWRNCLKQSVFLSCLELICTLNCWHSIPFLLFQSLLFSISVTFIIFFLPESHHLQKSISRHLLIVFIFCNLSKNNSQVISTSCSLKLVINIFWRSTEKKSPSKGGYADALCKYLNSILVDMYLSFVGWELKWNSWILCCGCYCHVMRQNTLI